MARIGIDIGGTFTDFALETASAPPRFLKLPTTPDAPERAVLAGVARLVREAGLLPADLRSVIHGTTLATNALIERRGARIAFITTEGFRDALEMGTESRHDHYDLDIEKPAPLVPRDLRFAVRERIAASGAVLVPLADDAIEALLPALDAAGIEAVAIGFLHSYANPLHEARAAASLRRLRPAWPVCVSSEVAPEIREYERFATTCVNAYVQPLMSGYLGRLEAGLTQIGVNAPLHLMLSNGGLCEAAVARRFPVRLLESGPAGGAILAADIAHRMQIEHALMVDIGGTTAKLCFIDHGTPQTARSIEVARLARFKAGSGIPLRFPVIELAEIGAGGGSIAHQDSLGRLRVGPASAGAEPGPACYARGGTAPTVTDAHLMLGRLDAHHFAGGRMVLNETAARDSLTTLASSLTLAPDQLASAICEIVDESMASAAREHAVETGKGIAGRVLIAIGGMAPLHAARLAAKLEIDRVVVPCGAGVGSALGFLRAPLAFESTRSLQMSLAHFDVAAANRALQALAKEMHAIVARAGGGTGLIETRDAWMRYRGQGYEIRAPLPVRDLGMADTALLTQSFETAYRGLYGRVIEYAQIEVLGWTVRVEAPTALPAETPDAVRSMDAAAATRRQFVDPGLRERIEGTVQAANTLRTDVSIAGPALVTADDTTIVVPTGFSAHLALGNAIELRRDAATAKEMGATLAPDIGNQILWDRLIGVVEEQARTLMRTAFSPTVREAGDLSAGLFDLEGRLVAQALTGTPGHVNSMAACARHFLAKYPPETMRAGDHYITNDPWFTSGHLHDVTVFSPAFHRGVLAGYFACTCHQVDIGGLGQGPDGRSVYEEGLYIPVLRLARDGHINEDLLDMVRANVRTPGPVVGDILSYVTANEVSARRLAATLEEFGEAGLTRIATHVIDRSRAAMMAAIARLPRGRWNNSMRLDGYDSPVDLCCAVEIDADCIRVSFEGSSPASRHGINLVLNYTRAYAAFGVRAAVAPEVPNNAGSLALVVVDAPEGSILNVRHPAPVCARHIIGQFLPDVVLGALAHALPGRIPAEGAACNWGLQLRGTAAAGGEAFEILFFNAGGSGARSHSDGLSATAFPSGIRSIPVEICEAAAPIVIWRKELRPDSGGAGRSRGGLGQRVEVSTIDGTPFEVFGIFDRVRHPARGRDGGASGSPGWIGLTSGALLKSMGLQAVPAGATLRIDVPGGGGFGAASERDAALEARDRLLGYVTRTR